MATPIRPASTVVLLRDGPGGVQAFMVRRHGKSGFMAGATVFPGGKVDALDGDIDSDDPGSPGPGFYLSALRELHEEAGVLLAVDGDGARVSDGDASGLRQPLEAIRDGHRVDAAAHLELLNARGWTFDVGAVVPFAHWITPAFEPRRFDTWFFAAAAPPAQVAAIDGFEHTHAEWLSPADCIARHEDGQGIWLPPPTYHTLHRLAAIPGDASAVLATLAAAGPVPSWTPLFIPDSDQGPMIVMPEDAEHPEFSGSADDSGGPARHRFVLRDGRFRYQRSA